MISKEEFGIEPIPFHEELTQSYMDYGMSVIRGRAIPDVRDGLKPVQRRIFYAMQGLGNTHNKSYKKSARVVGDTIGKLHPHGDSAVYDALVRLAQPFSMRYPLVDGQGNFGSIDGDSPAAMRYTEVRMTQLTDEFLGDINKETVDWVPNYDESLKEPVILPAKIPNLLINGSEGIAVGMATKIPPHNIKEVCRALLEVLKNPNVSNKKLFKHLPGPDFPGGAYILGREGIEEAYETGKGSIKLRAKSIIETGKHNKPSIVFTELPYQVNKSSLLYNIADLVKEKKIEGITDIRDESDRDGIRVVIELKKDIVPEVILNLLYKHTKLQTNFGMNFLAIVDGRPELLDLKSYLDLFVNHRMEVVRRRTFFLLKKARARVHILEGLRIALDNIDKTIKIIRNSKSPAIAKESLIAKLKISEIQAQAILDMRLQRLTALEIEKLLKELRELHKAIREYEQILSSETKVKDLIKNETIEIMDKYADKRRTEIVADEGEIEIEDLVEEEDVVVTITNKGYIKRTSSSTYKNQKLADQGLFTSDNEIIESIFFASTEAYLLILTNMGMLHWLKVQDISEVGKSAKGKPIANFVQTLEEEEKIVKTILVREFKKGEFVVLATKNGTIKRLDLMEFSNPRNQSIRAIKLTDNDELVAAKITSGSHDIIICSDEGNSVRFPENEIRVTGRYTQGVRGIKLKKNSYVVSIEIVFGKNISNISGDNSLFAVTEQAIIKRTDLNEYSARSRGGKGIMSIKTDPNNKMIGATSVNDNDTVLLTTNKGTIIEAKISDFSITNRGTRGTRIKKLEADEKIISLKKIERDYIN
jgi:DNA gyrase subunit A